MKHESVGLFPVTSSSKSTPKLYTSDFSVACPFCKYSATKVKVTNQFYFHQLKLLNMLKNTSTTNYNFLLNIFLLKLFNFMLLVVLLYKMHLQSYVQDQ